MRDEDDAGDGQQWDRDGLEPDGQAVDHHGRDAGLRRVGNISDGLAAGVVLGNEPDNDATDGTGRDAVGHVHADAEERGQAEGREDEKDRRAERAEPQGFGRVHARHSLDNEDTDQRAQQANGRHAQWQVHEGRGDRPAAFFHQADGVNVGLAGGGDHGRCDGDGCDLRATVAFKDVRAHARDVADVVADVVCDHARVTGIVFGDTCFDFADEVGTDVCGLGKDAAAHTVEQRDQRAAHREAVDDVCTVGRVVAACDKEVEETTDTQETHRRDGQAHDGAAEECDGQCLGRALFIRGDRGTDVGLGRTVHTDEAGDG